MLKFILALVALIGSLSVTSQAQTPLLQVLIDATPAGGTLDLPSDVVYPGPVVISKSIHFRSVGTRPAQDGLGRTFFVGATIVTPSVEPAITLLPGVDGVSFDGVEIAPIGLARTLVLIGAEREAQDTTEEEPRNISFNHVWIHGLPGQESQRGIAANGKFISVTNSRIDQIHGIGYDTQAICVWNGSGPFVITGNYLEAAGENVMFGGAQPSILGLIHSNITVRNNYFHKPLSWYVNDPSYAGFHWSVKNLFELKNARNVIVEGNIFENNWTDAQAGRAIAFTPRPSDSGPSALIEDVQFINNIVRNVGSGMILLGADQAPAPTDTRLKRIRVANNLWTVDGPRFASNGVCFTVINKTEDVTLDRNTCVQTSSIIVTDYEPNTRFVFTSNIARHNEYGIFGSGVGIGNPAIDYYFPGSVITNNAFAKEVNAPWNAEFIYPAGNLFPETLSLAIDSNFRSRISGVGVDIDALNAAISGGNSTPLPSPTPIPSPSPSPSATPTPTPVPSPTPTPLPSPSPTPTPRCIKWNPKGKCLKVAI